MSEQKVEIVTGPTVALVGATQLRAINLADWLGGLGVESWDRLEDLQGWTFDEIPPLDPDVLIEAAARSCYWSFNRGRGHVDHIANILDVKHGSVLEHSSFTLAIAGISRSCSHELVRHRHLSFSQLSQRYCGPEMVRFVVPPAMLGSLADWSEWHHKLQYAGEATRRRVVAVGNWLSQCEDAYGSYTATVVGLRDDMPDVKRKEVYEAARSVLPNCTETRAFISGNARSWRHFLHLRGSVHADAEIRRLASAVAPLLKAEAPQAFADVEVNEDGTVVVGKGSV